MTNLIKLLVALVVLALGAGFASLNDAQISLNYYFGTIDAPLALALIGALGIGLLLGFMASLTLWAGARREIASLRRSAKLAKQEVNNLRSIPLKQH